MLNLDSQISTELKQQNYEVLETDYGLIIRNKSIGSRLLMVFSVLLGLMFLIISLYLHFNLYYVAALLILVPFIYDRWRYPKSVNFDTQNGVVFTKHTASISKKYQLGETRNITVETSVRDSHVSAFEEGNQDFNYYLYYSDSVNERIKVAHFRFRVSKDDLISQLAAQINDRIKT